MTAPRSPEITPHTAIGVSLALLGVVLTLDNLGFVNAQAVFRYWPLIPILVGVAFLVQGREVREHVNGVGWMLVGTAFLLRNLDVFHFRLTDFLPLILVAIGVKVILGRTRRRKAPPGMEGGWSFPDMPGMPGSATVPPPPPPPPGFGGFSPGGPAPSQAGTGLPPQSLDVLRVFAMFWGADRKHRGPLAHVEVAAVMGGCDVDLRDATPTADPLVLQVFAMWGGIEIRVPPGWLVQNEAWPILGGIVDNTTPPTVSAHRVIVRGNAFMGGVEIKN